MPAKPKKQGTKTTTTATTSTIQRPYKEHLVPAPVSIASDDLDHRPNQPYQGAAPLRQVQQSPVLNTAQSNQQAYGVQGVFSPQSGVQSPHLGYPPQYQQQQQGQQQQQQHQHQQQQQQTPNDNSFYSSNQSPRSTNSTVYYPSDKPDSMAAAAAMHRPYPPIYHTPQSNSPASVTSPQTHDHGRPMFPQPGTQLSQPIYGYGNYQNLTQVQQSPYGSHNQSQLGGQPMLSYPPNPNQMSHGQTPSHQSGSSNTSPQMKQEPIQHYAQTPRARSALLGQQHPTPGPTPGSSNMQSNQTSNQPSGPPSSSNAAPGPIPATTPLVVRQDGNGVQWIAFEYSRDRVKMEYTIRCDVESVETNNLSQEFKSENCVYPRACVPKEQYKGNRLNYETDCNNVGWALAELNTCLRGKRGLIQRAVDSWRNSNQDPRLRSRRVRRQTKMTNKSRTGTVGQPQAPSSSGSASIGLSGSQSMAAPSIRTTGALSSTSQLHRHTQNDISPTGHEHIGGSIYSTASGIHRPGPGSQQIGSPNDLRHAQTFPGYQPYGTVPTTLGPSMAPPLHGGMHPFGRSGGNAAMVSKRAREDDDDSALFGDVPEGKKRKFILVEDTQKSARVRVKVTLDQIEMSEIPDSYRKHNSVYPRAYFPVQMQSATESTGNGRFVGDDVEEMDEGPPTVGRMAVKCHLSAGDGELDVAQLSKEKRSREERLNELGYRMAWGQSRVFSNRPIFLGRALDAFRNKQRSSLAGTTAANSPIPRHLETRPGKRKWLERTRTTPHSTNSPAPATD